MIPVFDPSSELRELRKQLDAAYHRVLKHGQFILGPEVAKFEQVVASYTGAKHVIGVSSGTRALQLACQALGVRPGDKVIVPTLALPTAFGVADSGAQLVPVDVRENDLQIDPVAVEQTLKTHKSIKTIVVVHLYGIAAPIKQIIAITKKRKIPVIEDAAQAFGVKVGGKHVGTFGDLGILSFYPTKNLGALGDAGAIITNSRKLAEDIRMRRMYGEKERYLSEFAGTNSRLDEIQAAFLGVKLRYFKNSIKQRRRLDQLYRKLLGNVPVTFLERSENVTSVTHLMVIRTKNRDRLKMFLAKRGIQTSIHYPRPIHLQPAFKYLGYKEGDFPVAEHAAKTLLSLPFYPTMTNQAVEKVCHAIKQFYAQLR